MTDGAPEQNEAIELPPTGDTAFATLMDTLVADEEQVSAGEGSREADAAGAGAGSPAPPAEGTPAAPGSAPAPTAGDGGSPVVPGDSTPDPAVGRGTVDATSLTDDWARVTTGFEEKQTTEFKQVAFAEVKEEYAKYFEAIEAPARTLVGQTVPSVTGDGEEVLRDSDDARDWQEAIKSVLVREVGDRVSRKVDEVRPMMETLHSSVGLFQNNPDLIPGTRTFDKELAEEFVKIAQPYEMRLEGKLTGYTIPVQPLVAQIRQTLTERRAKAPAPAPAAETPTAAQQRAAEAARNAVGQFTNPDAPQAGLQSKAGTSGEGEEDFSALFGTLGLPGLRI